MKRNLFFIILILLANAAKSQTTYTFLGNGNWSNPLNWENSNIPPQYPSNGSSIIINPDGNGECIVDIILQIPKSVIFKVNPGKKLKIPGDLNVYFDSTVVLNNNVHVIDSTTVILNSTALMLNLGIYEFDFLSPPPVFNIGDIIIGATDSGYIRKLTGISIVGNTYTFQTIQGNMEEVFKQGFFDLNLNTEDLQRPASGYTYTFNDVTLYQSGPLFIKLNNGSITLDPNWNFNFNFQNSSLQYFEMGCQNASLTSSFEADVIATQAISLSEQIDTLNKNSPLTVKYTKWILVSGIPVPIKVVMNLYFICKYSATIDATINRGVLFNSSNTMDLGIKYADHTWLSTYQFNSTNSIMPTATTGNVNATINMSIAPTFSFKFYGFIGPYASVGLNEQIKASVASPSLDWNFSVGAWLKTILGAKADIFGTTLFDYNKQWDTDTLFYKTPYKINLVSGDNQSGHAFQYLPELIKVKVLDIYDNPQPNVPVHFAVAPGIGEVEDSIVDTDNNGFAMTRWKISDQVGTQYLKVSAFNGDESPIQNAPLTFMAMVDSVPILTTSQAISITKNSAYSGGNIIDQGYSAIIARGVCWNVNPNPTIFNYKTIDGVGLGNFTSALTNLSENTTYYIRAYAINNFDTAYGNQIMFVTLQDGDSTFVDNRDGQIYPFRHYGTQVWMTKNLNFSAPNSWCYENPGNCLIYGRLYTLESAQAAPPPGWHLPSEAEWDQLRDHLGGVFVGGAMKEAGTTHWQPLNVGGNNSLRFNGLPAGQKEGQSGEFQFLGTGTCFWVNNDSVRCLIGSDITLGSGSYINLNYQAGTAFSVRCIRDY